MGQSWYLIYKNQYADWVVFADAAGQIVTFPDSITVGMRGERLLAQGFCREYQIVQHYPTPETIEVSGQEVLPDSEWWGKAADAYIRKVSLVCNKCGREYRESWKSACAAGMCQG